MVFWEQVLAQQGIQAMSQPSAIEQLMPFVFVFLIIYFLLIRPQQKRHKRHQDFLSKIKMGDKVLTSGGIFGTIGGITDQFCYFRGQ